MLHQRGDNGYTEVNFEGEFVNGMGIDITGGIVPGDSREKYSFEVDPILRMIREVIWPSPTNRASITGMVVTQLPLNTYS